MLTVSPLAAPLQSMTSAARAILSTETLPLLAVSNRTARAVNNAKYEIRLFISCLHEVKTLMHAAHDLARRTSFQVIRALPAARITTLPGGNVEKFLRESVYKSTGLVGKPEPPSGIKVYPAATLLTRVSDRISDPGTCVKTVKFLTLDH